MSEPKRYRATRLTIPAKQVVVEDLASDSTIVVRNASELEELIKLLEESREWLAGDAR